MCVCVCVLPLFRRPLRLPGVTYRQVFSLLLHNAFIKHILTSGCEQLFTNVTYHPCYLWTEKKPKHYCHGIFKRGEDLRTLFCHHVEFEQ